MTGPASRDRQAMNRATSAPVASPCISVCRMDDATGLCSGCLRTLDEIAAWVGLDAAARLAVWDAIDERKKAADANR